MEGEDEVFVDEVAGKDMGEGEENIEEENGSAGEGDVNDHKLRGIDDKIKALASSEAAEVKR